MRLVILESPYAGDVEKNVEYARRCVMDSLFREEAPLASHLLYTQERMLDDTDPTEREIGIQAGLAWVNAASKTVVYCDLGITKGMVKGIQEAQKYTNEIEFRYIND